MTNVPTETLTATDRWERCDLTSAMVLVPMCDVILRMVETVSVSIFAIHMLSSLGTVIVRFI